MATIRPLESGDSLEAVSAIYARSWREAYQGIVPQSYLDRLEDGFWLPALKKLRRDSLAAEIDGVFGRMDENQKIAGSLKKETEIFVNL